MRKNIVFSTTRQWNPGDEIILIGILTLFRSLGTDFNAIIFNRHPDITPPYAHLNVLRKIRQTTSGLNRFLAPWMRIGFHDNSWTPHTDPSLCDLFVFAGSPEWSGSRLTKVYRMLDRHEIPSAFLGIGSGSARNADSLDPVVRRIAHRSLVIAARDTLAQQLLGPFGSVLLPCPSLFAIKPGAERRVSGLNRIALIYSSSKGMKWQRISPEAHAFMVQLYRVVLDHFDRSCEVELVCHYIDELPDARQMFPDRIVHYDYNSERYLELYATYDLVIGPRLHGIGAAASCGVPGILIGHDGRSSAAEGLGARTVTPLQSIDSALEEIYAAETELEKRATALRQHKRDMWDRYRELLIATLLPFLKSEVSRASIHRHNLP